MIFYLLDQLASDRRGCKSRETKTPSQEGRLQMATKLVRGDARTDDQSRLTSLTADSVRPPWRHKAPRFTVSVWTAAGIRLQVRRQNLYLHIKNIYIKTFALSLVVSVVLYVSQRESTDGCASDRHNYTLLINSDTFNFCLIGIITHY